MYLVSQNQTNRLTFGQLLIYFFFVVVAASSSPVAATATLCECACVCSFVFSVFFFWFDSVWNILMLAITGFWMPAMQIPKSGRLFDLMIRHVFYACCIAVVYTNIFETPVVKKKQINRRQINAHAHTHTHQISN